MQTYDSLPDGLPIPVDDGACDHLVGMKIPDLSLDATNGETINLSQILQRVVIYCYPKTGRPGVALPDGWDEIPGARGCTPQSCSFRDHYAELAALGASVYGISTQSTVYQQEMVERLHLPFPVLSDVNLEFARSLNIPTFKAEGQTLMKRVTLIMNSGSVEAVHYPVFPSNSDPQWVLDYLKN